MRSKASEKLLLREDIKMKNITKRIIAVISVLAVASMGLAGCGKKNGTTENSAPKQYPFVVGEAAEGNALTANDPNVDLNKEDPVAGPGNIETPEAEKEPQTEVVEATEADGQPATQYVPVTEADGQPVTEADGQPATEAVVVTQVVTKPAEKEETTSAPAYTSKEDGRYAMWLDISKDENFFFEGDMIRATFKVKEGIPDGDYSVRISPDLSDVAGVAIYPEKTIDGVIRVNNGEIEAVDVSQETGMVFWGDSIACKQGDTIDFNINIKNNSGLVAFCVWFYFDSNALEFIEATPSGEFETIARDTEVGGGNRAE